MGQQNTYEIQQGEMESSALEKEETLETAETEFDSLVAALENRRIIEWHWLKTTTMVI